MVEQEDNAMQQEIITFTITIDLQEITVHYQPRWSVIADYGHFEFRSSYDPPRRIPVSETGYLSHFSPMSEVDAAPSVLEYALKLAKAIMDNEPAKEDGQGSLF